MSHKKHEDATQHTQLVTDYSEIKDVQPSLTGMNHGGVLQQHVVASPRTSKKRSFLHSLSKGSQKRGTVITRPMNQDSMAEESIEVSNLSLLFLWGWSYVWSEAIIRYAYRFSATKARNDSSCELRENRKMKNLTP